MNYTNDDLFLIALSSIEEIDYKNKYALYQAVKEENGKNRFEKAKELLSKSENKSDVFDKLFDKSYLDYLLGELDKNVVKAITIENVLYPENLKNLEDAPTVLFVKGDEKLLNGNTFSIVGSRRSLPLSINLAEKYAKSFIDNGLTLVTGIAEGVDITVIKTALKNNGKIISVLCGGFNNIYPQAHENTVNEVIKSGLIVSENFLTVKAKPFMFPIRNRIIAGLGKGTLIVNGGLNSGTLYTANYAFEYGKDVFAIPYNVNVSSGEGNNELIKRGAILTVSPEDILEYYGITQEVKQQQILTEEERKIISAIDSGVNHVEEISEKTGIPFTKVCTLLSLMEIKKIVIKDGINEYSLA